MGTRATHPRPRTTRTTRARRVLATVAPGPGDGPTLDAADVSLGLGYLTAFSVLVVVDGVPESIVPVAAEAADYAGAHLVLLIAADGAEPDGIPEATTVLAAPPSANDQAFATLVGAYAAALDTGAMPRDAFSGAAQDAGWEALRAER